MPSFRGIDLSLLATSDSSVFPEFPHPDGSSATFGGLRANRHSGSMFLSPRPWKEKEKGCLSDDVWRCADPKISVYIPSAAETNFFFRYSITQPPIDYKYICFRVLINGRDIVSWGIDLDEALAGATHQALFQPSAKYQRYVNGVLMTQYGIESRCFRFVTHSAAKASVADDGGLIEVQVFRARARSRRAPQPDHYRGRERYGIALISNGLLENPHAASFFDYHLVDANDSPYASFRFHYRSWENLCALQLAPDEKPDFLCYSPSKAASPRKLKAQAETPAAVPCYLGSRSDAGLLQSQQQQEDSVFDFEYETSGENYKLAGAHSQDQEATLEEAIPRLDEQVARSERPLPQLPTASKKLPGDHGQSTQSLKGEEDQILI